MINPARKFIGRWPLLDRRELLKKLNFMSWRSDEVKLMVIETIATVAGQKTKNLGDGRKMNYAV